MPMSTDDALLVTRALDGDSDAFGALVERHLHPAWRIALAGSAGPASAEAAVVAGFADGVNAAGRGTSTLSVRTRIAAAVHAACLSADRATGRSAAASSDHAVIAAFRTLPVASRVALWLTEVEGGSAEQVAPVIGLDRRATTALAERAAAALRNRIAAEAASRATGEECRRALGNLPAHAAGRLVAADRDAVAAHIAGCGGCAAALAMIVSPRAALRHLVVPPPATLAAAVAARWAEDGGRDRLPLFRGWSERAVGAAAAAVLAVGLGGALLLGRDGSDEPEFAAPAGALDEPGLEDDPSLPDPVIPPAGAALSSGRSGVDVLSSSAGRPAPKPAPAPTATTAPPTTAPPTTAPPTTAPPTTAPPAAEDGTSTLDLGIVDVDVEDEQPSVEIEIPGLPPVEIEIPLTDPTGGLLP